MFVNPLLSIGIEALKKLVLEVFQKKGMSVIETLDVDISFRDFEREVASYVEGYLNRHSNIKIPGMRDSVNLDEKYSEAELLLGFQDLSGFESTDELNEEFIKIGNLLEIKRDKYERTPAIDFVKENSRLVVLGGPGMGKSTLLKKVGIEAWKQSELEPRSKQLLPILIELKNLYKNVDIDIQNEIIEEMKNCGLTKTSEPLLANLLEHGRILLILDGLDELTMEKRLAAMDAIQNFSDRYNNNKFIVSCRLAAYQDRRLTNFRDVEIAAFKDHQIYDTIMNWFSSDPDLGIQCWQRLILKENRKIKRLANTPLLLILICLSYQKTGRFPSHRSAIYEQAVEILLEKWNVYKGLIGNRYEGLDKRQKEAILEAVAYEAFQGDKIFVYHGWMTRIIDEVLDDMDFDILMSSDEIIKSIEVDNGIVLKQADQVYSFSHVTIQEFFCAQYITRKNSRIQQTIDRYILDRKWLEIFVFLAGLKQSEDVLELIEYKTLGYAEDQSIYNLLEWSNRTTVFSRNRLSPLLRRIFSIHIMLCFCLYFVKTDRLFSEILSLIRMHREFSKQFDDRLSKEIRRNVSNFDNLIAALITTRQNSNAYLSSPKSVSGKYIKIKDMRKQVSFVCRQCKKANKIISEQHLFSNADSEIINIFFDDLERDTASQEASPSNYLNFCNQIASFWIDALGIEFKSLEKIQSPQAKKMSEYLYCLLLLKRCGEAAKYYSRKKWEKVENRMLLPNRRKIR